MKELFHLVCVCVCGGAGGGFFFGGGGGSLSQKRSGGRSRRKEKMKEGLAGERETQRCAIRSAGGGEETVEKIW